MKERRRHPCRRCRNAWLRGSRRCRTSLDVVVFPGGGGANGTVLDIVDVGVLKGGTGNDVQRQHRENNASKETSEVACHNPELGILT